LKIETKNVSPTLITHHFLIVSSYAYLFLFFRAFNYERTRTTLMSFVLTNSPLVGKVCSYI